MNRVMLRFSGKEVQERVAIYFDGSFLRRRGLCVGDL